MVVYNCFQLRKLRYMSRQILVVCQQECRSLSAWGESCDKKSHVQLDSFIKIVCLNKG